MSLIILQVIPSLIGYIIILLNFNCATWSFVEQKFRRWANLTSTFLVISIVLEQQAWFQVYVVPMVSITFCFIIPLAWCHHQSITSSWNLSTNVSWSSSTFWGLPGYQLNSWWEIPSLPLCDLYYHRRHHCLPSDTNLILLWSSLLSSLCYVPPWIIIIFYIKDVVRNAPPLKNSCYSITSRHLRSFLGPRVVSNRNTGYRTLRCKFKTSSNFIVWKWMVDSFILLILFI